MVAENAKDFLKLTLRKEVSNFCKKDARLWKEPIRTTLCDLQQADVQAVFFGGTLRSLLISRLFKLKRGRPRDIDIVVSGISLETLRTKFENNISRETRFGGLQLRRKDWQFDVWPLQKTWAFNKDAISSPTFDALPYTTFFNLEAIAIDVWPRQGQRRIIYSGDDQFFDGILAETLEINREENPFPGLCVVRAFAMSTSLNFKIGPRLASYIYQHGTSLTDVDLQEIQLKHYGQKLSTERIIHAWIRIVGEMHKDKPHSTIAIHPNKQLELWENPNKSIHFRVHHLLKEKSTLHVKL